MVGVALTTIVLVLGAVYVAGYLLAGDRAPRNASVGGVAIGGLSRAEAVAAVQSGLAERAGAPITLSQGETSVEIDPAEAGLGVDADASVEASGAGRSWNPAHIWQVLTGGTDREPETVIDRPLLEAAVADFAQQTDTKAKDATIGYEGTKVEVGQSVDAVTLDQEKTAEEVVKAYLVRTTVVAPAEIVAPDITTAEAEQVAKDKAEPAVSAPVTVDAGKPGTFEVSPAAIAAATTFEKAEGGYVVRYDADALLKGSKKAIDQLKVTKPKDAYWRLEGGKPTLVKAVDGSSIEAKALLAAVEPVLTKSGGERKASVEPSGKKAEFSTEDAEKAKVTEVVGQFTTKFPVANGGEYRNTNLGQVAKRIDNYWLAPGETFSMNDVVGERSAENGFVDGYVIQGGVLKKETGGGVSQGATTIFNAAFFAGLEDVEHHPHTLYFPRYPAGREATVYYGSLDLRFKNDTPYGVIIEANRVPGQGSKQGSLTVKIWSTKVYDEIRSPEPKKSAYTSGRRLEKNGPECEYQAPIQGFTADYHRSFIKDGKEVKRQDYRWTYDPGDEIVCR